MIQDDFEDLTNFLEGRVLALPVRGTKYVVEEASAADWLKLSNVIVGGKQVVSDNDVWKLSLGETLMQQMIDAGVRPTELALCGLVAYYWQTGRPDRAREMWESGGKALAVPPVTSGATTKPRTRTGAASTTRKRNSGTGTTTRRKSATS